MKRIALVGAMLLSGCGSQGVPSWSVKPEGSFTPGGQSVLNLAVRIDGYARDGRLIEAAGAAVKQVGADMIGGRPPVKGPFKAINFMVYAPRAQADASTDGRVMHLSYDAMELRHAVHMGMDGDAILAGGTDLGWWSPSNDDIIADYCTTRQGGAFCSRVAAD